MSPPWQFVSSQPYGSTVNPETRKLVRETAMRSFRRRQRLQGIVDFRRQQAQAKAGGDRSSQANSATSTAGTSSHCADVQGTILEEWANEDGFALHEQMALVMNGPGAVLDPFNQTALYNQHDAPRLFMHFVRDIAPILQRFASDGCWNPIVSLLPVYALRDSVMLESLLFHAAIEEDERNARPWTASTWYHRGRSIELVNQRLDSGGDESTSDLVIGAVNFIGVVGNITGDVGDLGQDLVHRKALRKMVEMRGGLEELGCNGVLAMLLPIGDLISAAVFDTLPILERPNVDAAATILGVEIPNTFAKPIESSLSLPAFRIEILTLIPFINKLAAVHADSPNNLTASTDNMIAFSKICSAVEHRLLSVRTYDTHPDALVCEATRIAELMCMTYLFRNMTRTASINVGLHRRLGTTVDAIETWSIATINVDTTRLLLWAISIGSLTALESAWFVRQIKRGIRILEVSNLDELNSCLSRFVWTSSMALDFVRVWEHLWPSHDTHGPE